jgi:hypothetical protein
MKPVKIAILSPAEVAAHQAFEKSDKQPDDFRTLANRLEAIARASLEPRPDLLESVKTYRRIADDVERMTNESIY